MQSFSLLTLLATPSLATKLLLPLYQYPEGTAYDGVYSAIEAHPSLEFQIILNADSGPGGPEPDEAFATATAKLSSYTNVQLLGYVHCLYGEADTSDVAQNVSDWASWNSYSGSDLSIDGIFFDETPNTPGTDSDVSFMTSVVDSAKSAFGTHAYTGMFNPGSSVEHSEYWDLANYNVIFEDDASAYSDAILTENIPTGKANQSSILLPDFASVGDASQAQEWLDAMIQAGVGSAHILNYGYMEATSTVEPAPISAVALVLAAGTGSTSTSSSTTAVSSSAVDTSAAPTSEATYSAEAGSADAPAVTPAAEPSVTDSPTVVVYTSFATSYITVEYTSTTTSSTRPTATGSPSSYNQGSGSASAKPSQGGRHSWGWSARHRTGMKKHSGHT